MNNRDHYQFIRSLRLPTFEGIPIFSQVLLDGITHEVHLVDFNYDSLSFSTDLDIDIEIGKEIRINFQSKTMFKKYNADVKITILRASKSKDKIHYGASINNTENVNYLEFIKHIISRLKPNHLKNLIFKNTFEIRDVPKEESFHQFQILCNTIQEIPELSIEDYIAIVQKFAPFAKIEIIDYETIEKNKNLLEVYLVSRFKVNRFNDVTKWLLGFSDWNNLLSISIENRYITYHQKCSNFFKLCYSKVKSKKNRDNHKEAIAYSSNILFIQSNENHNAWMFFKKIYDKTSILKFHKFVVNEDIEAGFYEYVDISQPKDVLLLQISKIPGAQELLLLSQKLKYFKGYKIVILGNSEPLEIFRHYFEQTHLIGHIQSHWRFVFANNEIFSRFISKDISTKDNKEIKRHFHKSPSEYYEFLESIFDKKTG